MKKKLLLKIGLIVFSIGLFCPFFTSAIVFHLTGLEQIYALSKDKMAENMMYVHFADNGNNFGGFLYFSNGIGGALSEDNTELYTLTTDSDASQDYECRSKVRGFYYNAERGERLWPLDDETRQGLTGLAGLETTGGIYTVCAHSGYEVALGKCEAGTYSGCENCDYNVCAAMVRQEYEADGYGYYGSLEQEYSGQKYNLTMGVKYDTDNDFISIKSGSKLEGTFVRINNKFPVGFLYDTKGGIGLVGCRCNVDVLTGGTMKRLVEEVQSGGLASVFSYDGTGIIYKGSILAGLISCDNISFEDVLLKIVIEGIMGLSDNGKEGDTKFGGLGNSSSTKMQYFGTKSVSNITMMNYARRRAELLCRGKWTNNVHAFDNGWDDKIICWNGGDVTLDESNGAREYGRTLIVKNGDVTITSIPTWNDSKYYDIFILSGNLLIDETNAGKFVIDDKGFPTNVSIPDFMIKSAFYTYNLSDLVTGGVQYCVDNPGASEEDCPSYYDVNGDGSIDGDDYSFWQGYVNNLGTDNWVAVASVINGNFIVNGSVKATNDNDILYNKYFIHGKFTTKDTFNALENVFSWRCNSEMGRDAYPCPKFEGNPYRNASLVVIDQNYSSPLLQS